MTRPKVAREGIKAMQDIEQNRKKSLSNTLMKPGKEQFQPIPTGELWFVSFESLDDFGSGLATYCRQVVNAAMCTGRRIRLFEISRGGNKVTRESDGAVTRVFVPDTFTEEMSPLGYWMNMSWAFADAICKEIESIGKPNAIEIPDGMGIGYFLLQRKLVGEQVLQSVPVLLVAHTPMRVIDQWKGSDLYALPNWWMYRAEKWCYLASDAIITLSPMMENILKNEGYIRRDQYVVRSANPYIYKSTLTRRKLPDNLIVGMASRMINWKGLREALELARKAKETEVPFRLELCGGASDDFKLAKHDYADLFDDGTVVYLGTLSASELVQRRTGWTCQIHPSKFDNFPYTVIEALVAGCPCYMTSGNGVLEILPKNLRDELVVDFSKPSDVLGAIQKSSKTLQLIPDSVFSVFGAEEYFRGRDTIIQNTKLRKKANALFPFVDQNQAKVGLRPNKAVSASVSGARLSVVVPYYNMGRYIDECVQSIFSSSIKADIIIINDGSTDLNSIRKLDEYRSDPRIRIIDVKNGGVARARNIGVENVATEFVALLDADDSVEPSYYEKAVSVLDSYDNVGFVGCWANDFEDETRKTLRYWPTFNAEPMPNICINNTNCQALVYRTVLYCERGNHDPELKMYLDDWDGMLGLLEGGYFGVMLPEPLFNYRQRKGSIFSSGRGAWSANYSYIVNKRVDLYRRNAQEALLFTNANGPNHTFHLLGWPTPLGGGVASTELATRRRLKHPHRLARSIAKRLMRFAMKGYH